MQEVKRISRLGCDSIACAEQTRPIDKKRIIRYLGRLPKDMTDTIAIAAAENLGVYIPETIEAP